MSISPTVPERRRSVASSLPLPIGEAGEEISAAVSFAGSDKALLWLCLYFPRLPLEVLAGVTNAPLAVLADAQQKPVVLLCNDAAACCGVRPGMSVNAALALSPDLEIRPRECTRERELMEKLGRWATRFTPAVSLDPSGALLLEIATSLRLFGDPAALRDAAAAGARSFGSAMTTAIAPTARAAVWLARAGQEVQVTDIARLPAALARLPVNLSGWPSSVLETLRRMGVRRIGDCVRLPRDGLARRLGARYLAELDEALGRRAELREYHRPPDRFRETLDLPAETRESPLLIEALQILLCRLKDHLQSRQTGARILWLRLRHRTAPATLLRIGLLRPSANVRHLHELAAIHLSAASVPAPVTALTLDVDVADIPPGGAEDLLGRSLNQEERTAGLMERLRARLGFRAVHGLWTRPEHRPEHAWQAIQDPEAAHSRSHEALRDAQRPLWILEDPSMLALRSGGPFFHGALEFESGPERIETGWWDGQDIERDYYVTRNPQGMRLWIFRDRRRGGWYLHGLFG